MCQQCSKSQWVLFATGVRRRCMEHQHVAVRSLDCTRVLIAALLFGFPRVLLSIHVYLFIKFTCFIVFVCFLLFFFSHKVTDPNVVLWLIMEHGSTIGCEARSRSKYRTTRGVLYYIICVRVLTRVRVIKVTLIEETIRRCFVHEHFILSH